MSLRYIPYSKEHPMTLEDRMLVFGASQKSLWSDKGLPGKKYLFEERRLDPEVVAGFRLGYVPEDVSHPFSERIVMPIYDSYDKLLALSVRPITNDKDKLDEYIKYWNESYPKGENLFGMNRAKMAIVKHGFAILVEGQFDVMAMHSFGFENTVGVLGGAFTPMQAVLLRRWTEQVIIMFDSDKAGQTHVDRCFEILKAYGFSSTKQSCLKAVAVKLAAGKDPSASLVSSGSILMKSVIREAVSRTDIKIAKDW